jgi:hypothetical protein
VNLPDPSIVNLVAQTGGLLGLAVFAIWMLNRVWESRLDEAKRNAREILEMRNETRDALNRNTEVMTRLCERLER